MKRIWNFLASRHMVSPEPIKWLENFHFSGTIRGYREGEMFFPNSPILQVEEHVQQCTLLETLVFCHYELRFRGGVPPPHVWRRQQKDRPCMDIGGRRTNEWAAVAAAGAPP